MMIVHRYEPLEGGVPNVSTPAAESNAELVRTTLDLLNANDLDACVARMAPDFVMHLAEHPEPLPGREAWRQGAMMLRQAFADLHIDLDDIVADESRVAVRLTLQGTHTGEFLGFAPTGRRVKYVSHEFYRVADGAFAEEWVCSDTATLFGQLTEGPPA
jgi:steroid delta-isomerase-like uncharacterized protein